MSEAERDEAEHAMLSHVLDAALNQLGEHFENVQIFVNRNEGLVTRSIEKGRGNIYAREGHVKAWLEDGGLSSEPDCDCEQCQADGEDD